MHELEVTAYDVFQTAELLGLSPFAVRRMLRGGALKGLKLGPRWRIRAAELTRYLKQREAAYTNGVNTSH